MSVMADSLEMEMLRQCRSVHVCDQFDCHLYSTGDTGCMPGCSGEPQYAVPCLHGSNGSGGHRFGGSGPGVCGKRMSRREGMDGRRGLGVAVLHKQCARAVKNVSERTRGVMWSAMGSACSEGMALTAASVLCVSQ